MNEIRCCFFIAYEHRYFSVSKYKFSEIIELVTLGERMVTIYNLHYDYTYLK